jgi:hypothetical protein
MLWDALEPSVDLVAMFRNHQLEQYPTVSCRPNLDSSARPPGVHHTLPGYVHTLQWDLCTEDETAIGLLMLFGISEFQTKSIPRVHTMDLYRESTQESSHRPLSRGDAFA